VTISGGPDRSLADPAATEQQADDPVVLSRDADPLDGDDITVDPGGAPRDPSRRILVAAIVLVLVVVAIGTAIALGHRSSKSTASSVSTAQPAHPPAAHPTPVRPPIAVAPLPTPTTAAPAQIVTPSSAVVTPPTNPANAVVIPPPVAVTSPPPAPPVTAAPASPPSVLQWHATPAALSVAGGKQVSFTVSVANPTNGTVDLPTPLSCAPTVRGPKGVVIGASICEQVVQAIAPHQHLTQRYTIDATTTGDPSGQPLKAGAYTASIQNLFEVKITVTAA
jgi:hypothetical protein